MARSSIPYSLVALALLAGGTGCATDAESDEDTPRLATTATSEHARAVDACGRLPTLYCLQKANALGLSGGPLSAFREATKQFCTEYAKQTLSGMPDTQEETAKAEYFQFDSCLFERETALSELIASTRHEAQHIDASAWFSEVVRQRCYVAFSESASAATLFRCVTSAQEQLAAPFTAPFQTAIARARAVGFAVCERLQSNVPNTELSLRCQADYTAQLEQLVRFESERLANR